MKPRGKDKAPREPYTSAGAYARELGITRKRLHSLGGEAKLRALSDDARIVLLKPQNYGFSRTVHKGGLAARGMKPRTTGYIIQPQIPMDLPIEALMSDEEVVAVE